jgi:hypothetical protein
MPFVRHTPRYSALRTVLASPTTAFNTSLGTPANDGAVAL